MQNFLPTTNTTPGFLALDYFTRGPSEGFNQVRNDKRVAYSIQPVLNNESSSVPFTPDHQPGDTYSMAIGNFDQAPTQGTVALQVGAQTGGALATIPATVSQSDLQTALNTALTAESKPQVQILALGNGSYIGTATSNGAITDGFFGVVSAALLYPISNAFFTVESLGSPSSPYRFLFTMRQAPMCYSEPDTDLPDTDVLIDTIQAGSATQSKIQQISFTVPQVSAGSYRINAVANSVDATCGTVSPLMSARDIGLILAQHPEIKYATPGFDDNVAVEVLQPEQRVNVTFIGTLKNSNANALSVENIDLVGPKGLSGEINYNTFGLLTYSRSQTGETFTLTRQIQRYRGTETRTLYSGPVVIYKELIDASTAVPTPTINYYTASQVDTLLADKMDVDAANATLPDALNNLLPSQTGNSGKILKTNGTSASWQDDADSADVVQYQTSDLAFTSNTTLANLSGISIPVTSGSVWRIEATFGVLISGGGGAKIEIVGPSIGQNGTTLITVNFNGQRGAYPDQGLSAATVTTSDNGSFVVEATVTFGANGNLTMRGAQFASDAAATTFKAGATSIWAKRLS